LSNVRESPPETADQDRNPKRPHVLKRLYHWVLHWADTPYAGLALFLHAFSASSFFPIPPDPLLMAMALGNRRKAFRYAAICSIGSILGGVLGFFIGYYLWPAVGQRIVEFYGIQEEFSQAFARLKEGINIYVFVAAFTPIPYKVFTIAAGLVAKEQQVSLLPFLLGFIVASSVGRAGRFFLVATLLHFFGERMRRFIDKYFNWCALAFGLLLVGAFVLVKYLI